MTVEIELAVAEAAFGEAVEVEIGYTIVVAEDWKLVYFVDSLKMLFELNLLCQMMNS